MSDIYMKIINADLPSLEKYKGDTGKLMHIVGHPNPLKSKHDSVTLELHQRHEVSWKPLFTKHKEPIMGTHIFPRHCLEITTKP